jgi:hypothetical protein
VETTLADRRSEALRGLGGLSSSRFVFSIGPSFIEVITPHVSFLMHFFLLKNAIGNAIF